MITDNPSIIDENSDVYNYNLLYNLASVEL